VQGAAALNLRAESAPRWLSATVLLERRDGHRHVFEQLSLLQIVGDQCVERGVAVLLEPTLDEVGAATAAGRDVRDPDAFCWGLRRR
jgi:hypothetical protein